MFAEDLFVKGLTHFRGIIECRLGDGVVLEAGESGRGCFEGLVVLASRFLLLFFWVELSLAHGKGDVRCFLEDGEVFGGRADVLTHLDAAGSGVDHSNALVFQVNAVLGPCGGVEVFTLEVA